MTVETTSSTISYTGNGSVTVFAYNFLTYSADHIFVYLDDVEQTSGYTVSGVDDESGGDVIFTIAPSSGVEVRIDRTVPETQLTEFREYGPFPAKSNERGLDLNVMIGQQQSRDTSNNLSKKMDKVTSADDGNIVVFSSGNAADSNTKISGLATSEQGGLADTSIQPGDNISELANNSGYTTASEVESRYLSKIDASSNYLGQDDAASKYLSKGDAISKYLQLSGGQVTGQVLSEKVTSPTALIPFNQVTDLINKATLPDTEGTLDWGSITAAATETLNWGNV